MYQPKIADEHIRTLYQWAKRLEIPMTRLVNRLLAHGLARLEQGVEHIHKPTVHDYARKTQRTKQRARYGTTKSECQESRKERYRAHTMSCHYEQLKTA